MKSNSVNGAEKGKKKKRNLDATLEISEVEGPHRKVAMSASRAIYDV